MLHLNDDGLPDDITDSTLPYSWPTIWPDVVYLYIYIPAVIFVLAAFNVNVTSTPSDGWLYVCGVAAFPDWATKPVDLFFFIDSI